MREALRVWTAVSICQAWAPLRRDRSGMGSEHPIFSQPSTKSVKIGYTLFCILKTRVGGAGDQRGKITGTLFGVTISGLTMSGLTMS